MNKIFNLNSYLTAELKKLKAPRRAKNFLGEKYIGGANSKLIFLNLRTSEVRLILKRPVQLFFLLPQKQFNEFEKIWNKSQVFEIRMLALYWLESLSNEQLVHFAPRLKKWANRIDNWADSDTLCGIYARIFETSPDSLLKIYKIWNKHKNLWLRRCSMVGVFYYSRTRKKMPSFKLALSLIKPHLLAKEYYVQKAVGWTTREMYNAYPTETTQFIKDNLIKIQPAAWYAASEKLPLDLKRNLVQKRRLLRKT